MIYKCIKSRNVVTIFNRRNKFQPYFHKNMNLYKYPHSDIQYAFLQWDFNRAFLKEKNSPSSCRGRTNRNEDETQCPSRSIHLQSGVSIHWGFSGGFISRLSKLQGNKSLKITATVAISSFQPFVFHSRTSHGCPCSLCANNDKPLVSWVASRRFYRLSWRIVPLVNSSFRFGASIKRNSQEGQRRASGRSFGYPFCCHRFIAGQLPPSICLSHRDSMHRRR